MEVLFFAIFISTLAFHFLSVSLSFSQIHTHTHKQTVVLTIMTNDQRKKNDKQTSMCCATLYF